MIESDIGAIKSRIQKALTNGYTPGQIRGLLTDILAALDGIPAPSKSVAIALLEDRIVTLSVHNQNLLITNGKYLERARDAEGKVKAWEAEMPAIEKRLRALEAAARNK